MGTDGTGRGLTSTACSRSPPQLSFIPLLSKVSNAMSTGGGRVGAAGGGDDGSKKPPPSPPTPGVHPRYIPKRGSVLKGIVRGVLGLISTLIGAPANNSGGHRVLPAPPGEGGGDGAEQRK